MVNPTEESSFAAEATMASTHASGRAQELTLGSGTLIGRYVVLSTLGAGAMGVVFAAYDPELDRKVALKLLKPRQGLDSEDARARLVREAQALAKLNHPNVVTVHDVGVHEQRVFVAMEFVEGQTIGEWMKAEPGGRARPWREVLRVFEAAGRGLAAAHAAGLAHRDFKPENVMLGADGRVRVMDFGLARAGAAERGSAPPIELRAGKPEPGLLHTPLTQTGALMGTPAYMAPELFAGADATPQSDQFSYCVALWEALHGSRPFAGDSLAALYLQISTGNIRAGTRDVGLPAWLDRLVRRGLSSKADERWPTMDALLDTLALGESRRRRYRQFALLGVLGLVIAGGVGWQQWDHARRVADCKAAGDAIDELWNDESREAVRTGIEHSGLEHASDLAAKTMPWLDEFANEWRRRANEACLAATVEQTWDSTKYQRAQWCLEDRRMAFVALLGSLRTADPATARNAIDGAVRLEPPLTCVDEATLHGMADPPAPELRPDIERVHAELHRGASLSNGAKYRDALNVTQAARAEAEQLGWLPLIALARMHEAVQLERTGAYEEAERVGIAAYMDAGRSNSWGIAAAAATRLGAMLGEFRDRPDEGLVWLEHAKLAIGHAGDPLGTREAVRLHDASQLYETKGELERARMLAEQALELSQAALGPDHPSVASDRARLAHLHYDGGQFELAKQEYLHALEVMRETYGAEHPQTAAMLTNLGVLETDLGEYDEALAHLRAALSIWDEIPDPNKAVMATTLNNLGSIHHERGEYAEALTAFTRATEIWVATLGPEHTRVAIGYANLGLVHHSLGDYERARELQERARAILVKELGPTHPLVASTMSNLGLASAAVGDHDEAIAMFEAARKIWMDAHGLDDADVASTFDNQAQCLYLEGDQQAALAMFEQALAIRERVLGPDHPHVAQSLTGLGQVRTAMGDADLAIEPLQRALTIRSSDNTPSEMLAETRFALARALWDASVAGGRDRSRALELAGQARDAFAARGRASATALAEVEQWLASHAD